MYAYPIMEAAPASTQAKSSILPALDISSVAWFVNPDGSTHTGQVESLELIDGIWWAACRYEQLPGIWILENRYAHNFFTGVGTEFALQLEQVVWFQRGDNWQKGTITDFYLECGEWFAVISYQQWYGMIQDEKPFCDDRADYKYEDQRDTVEID